MTVHELRSFRIDRKIGLFCSCLLIFSFTLFVYRANHGFLYTYDSAPNSLFLFNLLQHHTLMFDAFDKGYFYAFGASYVFEHAPNGHLVPIFPIGAALLTAPVFLFDYGFATMNAPFPDITSIAFEGSRLGYEKDAATIVGAVAAVLFFLTARLLAPVVPALVATIAFAFGTEMWTIGSQALWQHGSVNLVLLAMTYALLRAAQSRNVPTSVSWLVIAGACAGFLPVIRPTALAFSLAGLAFAYLESRRKSWRFVAGAFFGLAPGLLWNEFVFHSLIGGYAVNENGYIFSLHQLLVGISGLLISPSKGLLVYTPFVILSALGAVRAARERTPEGRLLICLSLACVGTFANYGFFRGWEGGASLWAAFLTDLSCTCALLLTYALPRRTFGSGRRRALIAYAGIAVVLCYCVAVQIVGANGEPESAWSSVPEDLTFHPERVWQISDTQIERDALTTYRLWRGNPTYTASYPAGFHGIVLGVYQGPDRIAPSRPIQLAPSQSADITAAIENTGRSPWYGYNSGVYFGQARVRMRVYVEDGSETSESYLYIAGSPVRGRRVTAIGTFRAPQAAGQYRVVFDVDCFQVAAVSNRVGAPQLLATLQVR